jgi:hypothetical protein
VALRATRNVRGNQNKEGTFTERFGSQVTAFVALAFDSKGSMHLCAPILHLDLRRFLRSELARIEWARLAAVQ